MTRRARETLALIRRYADGSAGGAAGPQGTAGADGVGVPAGGSANQLLTKADGTDYNTQWSDPPTLDAVPAPVAAVDFNNQQATSFRIENRTSDPATPTVGQIWLRTDL